MKKISVYFVGYFGIVLYEAILHLFIGDLMRNKQNIRHDFVKIVKDVERDFPELDIKMKIEKEKVVFLNSPLELYHKSISIILSLLNQIEMSLNLFPDSPVVESLEINNMKLKKALIMLILSRKDMFSKPE
ncbi:hypothetical protein CP10139811_1552 [Chlamydia ibidis]|uniref:Uncharacterized protein n=2 Tax=Chlamydia ibidis TaxID=1405396 RepID=S7KM15_9CHLA|nr:hypothetical protein CP10139811_1552 [Chlamydia ibidis]